MRILRRYILTCFLLISPSAWANGFYVGAGVAPQTADFNQNSHVVIQNPGFPALADVTVNTRFSGTGVMGDLFAGYRFTRQHFYLAGEIGAEASSLISKTKNSDSVHSTTSSAYYEMPTAFYLSVLPGYLYRDTTVFFARLGYSLGDFKLSTTDPTLANINRYLSGFLYGLGVEQRFTKNIAARLEYNQISYLKTQFHVIDAPADKTTKITSTVSQAMLSLVYLFS